MDFVLPVVSRACRLAEGPLWHPEQARLYWTDIPDGKIYGYHPALGKHECYYSGKPVGGFTFNRNASMVLFRMKDVCWIDFHKNIRAVQRVALPGMQRFNDVIAAPDGSVFAGTVGCTEKSGGLYHFKTDGTVCRIFSGTGCANGMGFSPDQAIFYWTCSTTRKIYAYEYKDGQVRVASNRVIYHAPPEEGIPDGMAVDREGNIWSARWDGFQLIKISPSGEKLDSFSLPRARITSVCFGGPQLDRFYITAAAVDVPEANADQCLFEGKRNAVCGQEEFFSALDPSRQFRIID